MDQNTLTTVLAVWGAILSTFSVGWQIYSYSTRKRLRVNLEFEIVYDQSKGTTCAARLINMSDFPVTVEGVGFFVYGKGWINSFRRLGQFMLVQLKAGPHIVPYRGGHIFKVPSSVAKVGLRQDNLNFDPKRVRLKPFASLSDGSQHSSRVFLPESYLEGLSESDIIPQK